MTAAVIATMREMPPGGNRNALMDFRDFHFHACTLRTLEGQAVMVRFSRLKSSEVHFRPALRTVRITNNQVLWLDMFA